MTRHFLRNLFGILVSCYIPATAADLPPKAAVRPVTDEYFGVKVEDPYRWMEAPGSPELRTFLQLQNRYSEQTFAAVADERERFFKRVKELKSALSLTPEFQWAGGNYFYLFAPPGKKDQVLVMRSVAGGPPRTLLDPAQFSDSSGHAAITGFQPSHDGRYAAVVITNGGSELNTMRVVETATGRLLPDLITSTRFITGWGNDCSSFFYTSDLVRVKRHAIGTPQTSDAVVFDSNSPSGINPPSGKYVSNMLELWNTKLTLFLAWDPVTRMAAGWVRSDASPAWRKVFDTGDDIIDLTTHGTRVYVLTSQGAPKGKVLSFDAASESFQKAKVEIPPSNTILAQHVFAGSAVGAALDGLYVLGWRDLHAILLRVPYDGTNAQTEEIHLPFQGSIMSLTTAPDAPGATFTMSSWNQGATAFRYDPETRSVLDTKLIEKASADFSGVIFEEVAVPSTNGASVPLSIVYQKGLRRDSSHPTLMQAYGAYGMSLYPIYYPQFLAWLERGGVWAVAHVRGGGELGEAWHKAGQKDLKQHTIDDYVACARYLIGHGYTSPAHLGADGGSAGGLAIGGFVTQHPELLRAAKEWHGVTDLLRFETTEAGAYNTGEFGSVKIEKEFRAMYALSPYRNVKDGTAYPAVLLQTGANDRRTPPWVDAKWAARLQSATTSGLPVLLQTDFDAGHIGDNEDQQARELSDEFTFFAWQLWMIKLHGGSSLTRAGSH